MNARSCLAALLVVSALPQAASARVTRLEVVRTEPAFGGASFGAGPYERVIALAHGELDPATPANAGIRDIALAPRNARGAVEYTTEVDIIRPADPANGNGVLLFNILNRGKEAYVAAIRRASMDLVSRRLMLQADAERLIAEAETSGVRRGA